MEQTKTCSVCGQPVRRDNATLLCKKCKVKVWVASHRERSNEIKRKYVETHPAKRKESWARYNHEKKDARKESNSKWYDKTYFSSMRGVVFGSQDSCDRCGSKENLIIHHKDRLGTTSKIRNNSLTNLVVLCNRCHGTVHARKDSSYVVA